MEDQLKEMRSFFSERGLNIPLDAPMDSDKAFRFSNDGTGKKNCWFYGHVMHHTTKAGSFIVATAGDWSSSSEYSFKTNGLSYDETDKAAIEKQMEMAKKRAAQAKNIAQKEAALEAKKLFEKGSVATHKYLERKKVKAHGALVSSDGYLMVPMRNVGGSLKGIQRIYDNGTKLYLTGQQTDGLFHTIPETADASKESSIIICEGFATGASIHEATGRTVVCTFSANNLEKVAKELYLANSEASFLIAADNDRFNEKENVGIEAAEKARLRCNGHVAIPQFQWNDEGSTDFNDLHCQMGIEHVRDQIEAETKKIKPSYVRCLGFDKEFYFFTSSSNKTIVKTSSLDSMKLLSIMPIQYWEARHPGKKGGVDWASAASNLMELCRLKGSYKQLSNRSTGAWKDDGRLVVHLGDRLYVDGREIGLHDIKSKFNYVLDERIEPISTNPMNLSELSLFRDCVSSLRLRDEWSKMFVMGFPVAAILAGYVRWRSHMHITGEAGAGKTTVLKNLLTPMVRPFDFEFSGIATEPGIRGKVGSSAGGLMIDEAESKAKEGKNRIKAILDYARQCSSSSAIHKGSANGQGVEYLACSSICMTSIEDIVIDTADKTRFIQIHVMKTDQSSGQWLKLDQMLNKINDEYSHRFFSRCVNMVSVFNHNERLFHSLISKRHGSRVADLWASILAGWGIVTKNEELNEWEATAALDMIDTGSEKSTDQDTDQIELLNAILTTAVDIIGQKTTLGGVIADCIRRGHGNQENEVLYRFGMKLVEKGLFINPESSELKRLMASHNLFQSIQTILLRIPGVSKSRQRIELTNPRGVLIPTELLVEKSLFQRSTVPSEKIERHPPINEKFNPWME